MPCQLQQGRFPSASALTALKPEAKTAQVRFDASHAARMCVCVCVCVSLPSLEGSQILQHDTLHGA